MGVSPHSTTSKAEILQNVEDQFNRQTNTPPIIFLQVEKSGQIASTLPKCRIIFGDNMKVVAIQPDLANNSFGKYEAQQTI